jgi:[FeFe] hydrogenase H-cluster maturation GTPase HydF
MSKTKDNKIHIGIFGRTNSGKSSFINALTGQDFAIVSEIPGTTTDPVKKSMEILGFGPVVLIDTAGINDNSELGKLRIEKTYEILDQIDISILIISENKFGNPEVELIEEFNKRKTPFLIASNKSDLYSIDFQLSSQITNSFNKKVISLSAINSNNLDELVKELIVLKNDLAVETKTLFGGLIGYGDFVLLITPIDSEAPEGRMILPQVNAIRDVVDHGAIAIVLRETEAELFFKNSTIKPKIVVTDSQVFKKVDKIVPKDIHLTGFSVLLARFKGDFDEYLKGTPKISKLQDEDRILLLESCTHTTSCEDIGRFKIPKWLTEFTGKKLEFDVVAGLEKLTRPIEDYSLIIQCGACVITRKQITNRLRLAKEMEIPITNYGMAIAYMHGVYERAIEPFLK